MKAHEQLTAENTISYQRQSVSKLEGRSKSLRDQASVNLETAEYYALPLTLEGQWDEAKNHGGDEWWTGGPAVGDDEKFRPVLTRIVEGIRKGTIKCVIVWDTSRLWRSVSICGILIDLMGKHNVLLYDRNGPCDISTPDGRLSIQNSAASAQHLREYAKVNSPRGVRKSREKGLVVVGSDILGFRNLGNGRIRVVQDEIDIVRQVFADYVSGKTKTTIARELTERLREQGVILLDDVNYKRSIKRTPQTADLVYLKQIDKLLRNPRYQGCQPHEGKIWECKAFLIGGEPAVSPYLFEEAQKRLEREKRVGNRGAPANYLASLFRCSYCAQTLQVNPVKQEDGTIKKFWQPKQHDIRSWCVHRLPSITESAMREYTEQTLMPLLIAEAEKMLSCRRETTTEDEIARLTVELDRIETSFNEKVALIFDDQDVTAAAPAMRTLSDRHAKHTKELKGRIADLKAKALIESATANDSKFAVNQLSKWDELDLEQKRAAIHKAIRWIALIPAIILLLEPSVELGRGIGASTKLEFHQRAKSLLTAWGTFHTAIVKRIPKPDGTAFQRAIGLVRAEPDECLGSAPICPILKCSQQDCKGATTGADICISLKR